MKLSYILAIYMVFFCATTASAEIHTQTVEYKHDDTLLEGYLAYDDVFKGKRPGVLIVHEWTGPGPYVKRRAKEIAALGYIAFAVDMYGKGIRPVDASEASKQASIYRSDRKLMRGRVLAGLREFEKNKFLDQSKIAAIGYCFGGGTVLELARSGADIAGVVSFHGNLDTPQPEDAKNIKARILVLHGADDPLISKEQVDVFQKEMRDARVDWQMIFYGGAVHSFTNPDSGDDPSKGAAYNRDADKRSWEAMKLFFREIFSTR